MVHLLRLLSHRLVLRFDISRLVFINYHLVLGHKRSTCQMARRKVDMLIRTHNVVLVYLIDHVNVHFYARSSRVLHIYMCGCRSLLKGSFCDETSRLWLSILTNKVLSNLSSLNHVQRGHFGCTIRFIQLNKGCTHVDWLQSLTHHI